MCSFSSSTVWERESGAPFLPAVGRSGECAKRIRFSYTLHPTPYTLFSPASPTHSSKISKATATSC